MSEDTLSKAFALLSCVHGAFARGCEHYDASGRLLQSPREVLETLLREGSVNIKEPVSS